MSYCRITIYELLQKHGNNPYNDVFFVEADPLFHNNGHFDYNLKSNYSVISKFKLKCPMGWDPIHAKIFEKGNRRIIR